MVEPRQHEVQVLVEAGQNGNSRQKRSQTEGHKLTTCGDIAADLQHHLSNCWSGLKAEIKTVNRNQSSTGIYRDNLAVSRLQQRPESL